MKKTIIIVLSLVLVLLAFTSCEEEIHVHTWDEGTVTKAATCSEKGVKTYTCTGCKETKTEDIAINPDNHTWDEGKETTPVTCEKDGEKTFTCTECGETKTEIIKTSGHDLKDTIITPAGYLTEGLKRVECTLCDYVEDSVTVEKKNLEGAWFESKIKIYEMEMVINLVYSTDVNNPGKIYKCIPELVSIFGSAETYQQIEDLEIDFTASIGIKDDEMFITIIDLNEPKDSPYREQKLTISETFNKDVPEITIEGLYLMNNGPLNITLSPIQAHSFEGEPIWDLNEELHIKANVCSDEHVKGYPKYLWFDYSSLAYHEFSEITKEPGYITKGLGKDCKVCGLNNGEIYLHFENTTWISTNSVTGGIEGFNGKKLIIEFDERGGATIKTQSGDNTELVDTIEYYSLNLEDETKSIDFNGSSYNYTAIVEENIGEKTITFKKFERSNGPDPEEIGSNIVFEKKTEQ